MIVIAVPDFEPTLGGTTRQARNYATMLRGEGHEVVVLTQRLDPSWARAETLDGVRVERVGPSARSGVAMKAFVAASAAWFVRHRSRVEAVIVVMYPDLAVAAAAAGLAGCTITCWAGLGDATDTLAATGSRAALGVVRRAALRRGAQVALSRAIADELGRTALGGAPAIVVPTPVDIERFRPPTAAERAAAREQLGARDATFVVVYAGHLRRLKRVERVVEAAGALARDGVDVRLVLLGERRDDLDDSGPVVDAAVAAAGIADRTTMPGPVADVARHLHGADVFVLASEREGLSNSVLEALACGVPAVVPVSAGGADVVDDGCGRVPATNDAAAITRALRDLLAVRDADPAAAATMRRRARERSLEFAVDRVAGVLNGLVAARRRPRE